MSERFSVVLNDVELDALDGLPLPVQLAYIRGIKPFVNIHTGIAGLDRSRYKRISLGSIARALYVEPSQGRKFTGSPTKKMVRGYISVLVSEGLISPVRLPEVSDNRLIYKCPFSDVNPVAGEPDGCA